ncbi:MAG: ribonuclease III [Candidatus Onthovivens sp.]|nr:ribonuclease III [Mollicutes bacterium]MDY4857651.1 ribonuclease III [Candidatus Onthovivens sp.]MDY4936666.1 ribonuclease III [Candidatus Onthovivens sp.]
MTRKNLDQFFKKFNITPKNRELFEMAFTHSSFNSDAKTTHHDYERLEFIGDSVLGFVVASLIYKYHPEMKEGEMTRTRSSLVQSNSLAKYAINLGYNEYIRAGHSLSLEEASKNHNILEDVFEAVIGALYLDQGIEFCIKFITKIFKDDVINFKIDDFKDYKSLLQEAMQAEYRESVTYRVIREMGPPHDKTFEVEVLFNNCILGKGSGKSKKEAEQNAASDALKKKATL